MRCRRIAGVRPGKLLSFLMEFPDPDIAKAHRMVVVLQSEREFFRRRVIGRALVVRGRPHDGDVILNQHSIVNHRDVSRPQQLAARVEARPVKNDVVGLPLSGRPRGIHQRGYCPYTAVAWPSAYVTL